METKPSTFLCSILEGLLSSSQEWDFPSLFATKICFQLVPSHSKPPRLLPWKWVQHHHLLESPSLLWGDPTWLNRQLLSWFSHIQGQQLLTGVPDIWHKYLNKSYRTRIPTVTREAAFNNHLHNRQGLLQQKTLSRAWAPSLEDALSEQFTPLRGRCPLQARLGPAALSLPTAPRLCFQEMQAQPTYSSI